MIIKIRKSKPQKRTDNKCEGNETITDIIVFNQI